MATQTQEQPKTALALPAIPVLAVNAVRAAILSADGEIEVVSHAQAQKMLREKSVMVCHAPHTRHRLGTADFSCFDVLELFAFVHPVRFCVPTPAGLAQALGLSVPDTFEDYPLALSEAVLTLLADLQREERSAQRADPLEMAQAMGRNGQGWVWTPFVCAALGKAYDPAAPVVNRAALNVWKHMKEWSEHAPEPPPAHEAVTAEESRAKLATLLRPGAESRVQQQDYAAAVAGAFAPLTGASGSEPSPHIVLAEAGTGVGKTLGYLAPASVWAEKNGGAVWISTYTKNLQKQIGRELERLYPDPDVRDAKVTIRKGRENYLCLLNLEDMIAGAALSKDPAQAVAAGLMARWAEASKNGDVQGGDFPGWLTGILGAPHTLGLVDRRGECVYAACDHYHKCFVEKAVRKAQHSSIVVANHALVMRQTADSGTDSLLPQRYVFDEGHHIFEAADSAFSGHLTARETHDLRRWIKGIEGDRKGRARGLKRRTEDLVAGDASAESALDAVVHAASALPAFGWSRRLRDANPQGQTEQFLMLVYNQVYARAQGRTGPYSLETQTKPLIDGLAEAGQNLKAALKALRNPLLRLAALLRGKLDEQAETLSADTRRRIESLSTSLGLRALTIGEWIAMLDTLEESVGGEGPPKPPLFIDWMEIERIDGKAVDIGLYRHWINPLKPFAAALRPHAHGIAITSATLRDATEDETENWRVARERTGTDELSPDPLQFAAPSPFDYAQQTRVFIINDVRKDDMAQVAAACRELFKASGGGAIGLFTSIQRLRAVHDRIAKPLEESGLPLYAQHVDGMDTGTLVDIFREDVHACLLGTDAVRDGVDVPGESLRLLVYDRVPWQRPTILHKARREAFGGRRYDELLTRLKLRQAYGRLIRTDTDKGVFVMLDGALPSRLYGAFPDGIEIHKTGLAEAIDEIKKFLS